MNATSILAQRVLDDVTTALNDSGNTRWPLDELIGHLNDGQRAIASLRSDAISQLKTVPLDPGTQQTIPANGRRFLRLVRNMGNGGATVGGGITETDLDDLARSDPDWHTSAAAALVRHYMRTPEDPRRFYVWPPALASGGVIGPKMEDPDTLPTNQGRSIAWSPNGKWLAIAHVSSPNITVWDFTDPENPVKFADPSTPPAGNGLEVAWSPDSAHVGVVHSTTPFVSVYPFSASGFGTIVGDPSTLPAGDGQTIAWSQDGRYVGVGHDTTPFMSIYPWTGAFGSIVGDPATLPAGRVNAIAWSPDNAHVGVGHDTTPFMSIYPWTGAAFGTIVGDPATLPAGDCNGIAWSPDNAHVGVGHDTTPFMSIYPWTGAFGSKVGDPATLPAGGSAGIAFSPDGAHVGVGHFGSPFFSIYPWAGAFGIKLADPASPPSQWANEIGWDPSGNYLGMALGRFPFFSLYKFAKAPFVDLVYARNPRDVPISTDTPAYSATTDEIDVPEIYRMPLINYILHRAFSKEDEGADPGKAAAHHGLFLTEMGVKFQADTLAGTTGQGG